MEDLGSVIIGGEILLAFWSLLARLELALKRG